MTEIFVQLLDVGTGDLFELPFLAVNFVEELNAGSQATFILNYAAIAEIAKIYSTNVRDMFTSSFREIWVEVDGTKVWYGVISEYNRTKDASGNYTLTIAAIDYFALFQKRRTGALKSYTGTDPATIPWDLINTSQGLTYGDFGITQGATASTGLSINIDLKFAEIRQTIIDLSNAKVKDSFDFDIDTTKKLNIYYPTKGTLRSGIVLDDNNSMGDAIKIPIILNITNSVYATGQGINNDIAYVNRQSSAPTIAAWKLLEDVTSDPQVSDTNILNGMGDRYLSLNELPLYQITRRHDHEDINITSYGVGDTLVVNVPEENISYAQYRVRKRTVDINNSGMINVTVDFLII